MNFTKTFFVLSIAVGLLLVGGCSGNTETSANVPGPPTGPQPAAGNTSTRDNNSVDTNSVQR